MDGNIDGSNRNRLVAKSKETELKVTADIESSFVSL